MRPLTFLNKERWFLYYAHLPSINYYVTVHPLNDDDIWRTSSVRQRHMSDHFSVVETAKINQMDSIYLVRKETKRYRTIFSNYLRKEILL